MLPCSLISLQKQCGYWSCRLITQLQVNQVGSLGYWTKHLHRINIYANSVGKDPENISMLHGQVELEHLLVHVSGIQCTLFTCADEGWNSVTQYSFVVQLVQMRGGTQYYIIPYTDEVELVQMRSESQYNVYLLQYNSVQPLHFLIMHESCNCNN